MEEGLEFGQGQLFVEVLVGLPASGKSTHARSLVEKGWRRVNKDALRLMMWCGEYSKEKEEQVDELEMCLLLFFLSSGFNVVVDDTNLNPERIKLISDTIDNSNISCSMVVNNSFCFVSIEECIKRDSERGNPVGERVIRNMYDKYKEQFIGETDVT